MLGTILEPYHNCFLQPPSKTLVEVLQQPLTAFWDAGWSLEGGSTRPLIYFCDRWHRNYQQDGLPKPQLFMFSPHHWEDVRSPHPFYPEDWVFADVYQYHYARAYHQSGYTIIECKSILPLRLKHASFQRPEQISAQSEWPHAHLMEWEIRDHQVHQTITVLFWSIPTEEVFALLETSTLSIQYFWEHSTRHASCPSNYLEALKVHQLTPQYYLGRRPFKTSKGVGSIGGQAIFYC